MINTNMRLYDYYTLGGKDAYAQPTLSTEPQGQILMDIEITSQSIQDNINYSNSKYIGLTMNAVDDTYVIAYGNEKLKVLYVNPKGRYKQVFLGDYDG